jgi:hypothetical protein
MSLITDAYCSLEALQKETGNSDEDLVDWFEECIIAASRWIDDYCYCDFLSHDYSTNGYTIVSSDAVGDQIFVPWVIQSLSEVKSGDLVIDSSLYEWSVGKRSIRLLDGSNWIAKNQPRYNSLGYGMGYEIARVGYAMPLVVKGVFGYAEPPRAVQTACCRIAAAWSHEKRREKMAMDGTRTSLLDERIPEESTMLLKRFRRLVN